MNWLTAQLKAERRRARRERYQQEHPERERTGRSDRISCVYAIFCKANGKALIGASRDLDMRWRKHHQQLRDGTHPSGPLQAAWDAYGAEGFELQVLQGCEPERFKELVVDWILKMGGDFNVPDRRGRPPVRAARARALEHLAGATPEYKARMQALYDRMEGEAQAERAARRAAAELARNARKVS